MVKPNKIILIFILVFFTGSYAYSFLREKKVVNGDIIEKIEFGEINWTTGELKVYANIKLPKIIKDTDKVNNRNTVYAKSKAAARLYAFAEAKKICKRNLINAVYNIRVKENIFIKDYLLKIDKLRFSIDKFIDSIVYYKKIYNKDNSVSVIYKIDIWGINGLLKAIENLRCNDEVVTNSKNISEITQTFTSLVIDARDIKGFYPSLNPEIYDINGNLLYSGCLVIKDKYLYNGGAKFLGDTDNLPDVKYIDAHSLTVRALKLKTKTSLVISRDSAELLFSSKQTLKYLKQGKVVIIAR